MKMCEEGRDFLRMVVRSGRWSHQKLLFAVFPSVLLLTAHEIHQQAAFFCRECRNSLRILHLYIRILIYFSLWFSVLSCIPAAVFPLRLSYYFSEPDLHIVPGGSTLAGICNSQFLSFRGFRKTGSYAPLQVRIRAFFPRSFARSGNYSTSSPAWFPDDGIPGSRSVQIQSGSLHVFLMKCDVVIKFIRGTGLSVVPPLINPTILSSFTATTKFSGNVPIRFHYILMAFAASAGGETDLPQSRPVCLLPRMRQSDL